MYISNYHRKIKAVFFVFVFILIACIARLLFIQFFRSAYLKELAKKQYNLFVELEPRRGTIFDVNLKPQALNISADSVFASSNEIPDKDKDAIARQLSGILNLNYDYLKGRLDRKRSFVWLCRKITPEQSRKIKALKLKGIGFVKESKRCYPNGYLTSQVMGFAGLDNTGLEGIELYYDKYLRGENGYALFLRDARQKRLELWEKMMLPRDGYDIVLNIDEVVQYIAERELDKAFKACHAKGGMIVVMDPNTGAILALANRPSFDLNEYAGVGKDQVRNRAISDMFEPGSVFKIVTLSAALEEKKVVEGDRFFCENGSYKVFSHTLHDHEPYGWLTFREVIELSSNIGTTKVAQILGSDILYRYIRQFGFGSRTGIDLYGEISGQAKDPRRWSKISIAAIPIGQEVGVTAIQLTSAMAAIANGGTLMKPYVVKEIRDKSGEIIKSFSPTAVRRVISAQTAARARAVLNGVIEEGTGKLAKIDGISAGGKTGTAQKLEPNGVYSHNKFTGSFVGYAPAEDPMVVVAVILDEPHPAYYGGVVSAPVFKRVAGDVIKYLRTKNLPNDAITLNAN